MRNLYFSCFSRSKFSPGATIRLRDPFAIAKGVPLAPINSTDLRVTVSGLFKILNAKKTRPAIIKAH